MNMNELNELNLNTPYQNAMLDALAATIKSLARVMNLGGGAYSTQNRYTYNLQGINRAMDAIGIDYNYDFDLDTMNFTAVWLNGIRYEI